MKIIAKKIDNSIQTTAIPSNLQKSSQNEIIAWANSKFGSPYKIMLSEDLPDEKARNSWEWSGEADDEIVISLSKVKDSHKNKLRLERKLMLEKLDNDLKKAEDDAILNTPFAPSLATSRLNISNKRKKLRDFPTSSLWDNVSTKEEVEALALDDFLI